jgi:phage head maturation protease
VKSYAAAWVGFGEITKTTERPDGSIEIEGIASAPVRDRDSELVTAECMREALKPWLASGFTPLRVMHQPIAAGRVTHGHIDGEGRTVIRGLVVDRDAILKLKAGVLRGLSIGGKVERRNAEDPTVIEAVRLVEISLVDSPACDAAVVRTLKADLLRRDAPDPAFLDASAPGRAVPTDLLASLAAEPEEPPRPLAKAAGAEVLAKVERQRDDALAKLTEVRREKDRLQKAARVAIAKLEGRVSTLVRDRADLVKRLRDTEEMLARTPKGATRAVPVAIEKAADTGMPAREPDEPEPTARDLIRKIHRGHR